MFSTVFYKPGHFRYVWIKRGQWDNCHFSGLVGRRVKSAVVGQTTLLVKLILSLIFFQVYSTAQKGFQAFLALWSFTFVWSCLIFSYLSRWLHLPWLYLLSVNTSSVALWMAVPVDGSTTVIQTGRSQHVLDISQLYFALMVHRKWIMLALVNLLTFPIVPPFGSNSATICVAPSGEDFHLFMTKYLHN